MFRKNKTILALRAQTTAQSAAGNYDYADLGDSDRIPLVNGEHTAYIHLTSAGELKFYVDGTCKYTL